MPAVVEVGLLEALLDLARVSVRVRSRAKADLGSRPTWGQE